MNATPWLEALLSSFVVFGVLIYLVSWADFVWNNRGAKLDIKSCSRCERAMNAGSEVYLRGRNFCPECFRKIGGYDAPLD